MSTPNPVNWFEIPVKNLERAKGFYETMLGLELAPPMEMGDSKMCFFPMEMGVPGAAGSLLASNEAKPSHDGTRVYFSVPKIDPVVAKVAGAGGKVCMPRVSIGEFGFIAHVEDPEGNCVGLHERAE